MMSLQFELAHQCSWCLAKSKPLVWKWYSLARAPTRYLGAIFISTRLPTRKSFIRRLAGRSVSFINFFATGTSVFNSSLPSEIYDDDILLLVQCFWLRIVCFMNSWKRFTYMIVWEQTNQHRPGVWKPACHSWTRTFLTLLCRLTLLRRWYVFNFAHFIV